MTNKNAWFFVLAATALMAVLCVNPIDLQAGTTGCHHFPVRESNDARPIVLYHRTNFDVRQFPRACHHRFGGQPMALRKTSRSLLSRQDLL